MVTDGMGRERPVMYGFVRYETYHSLRLLFEIFQQIMGNQHPVKTFVMDKMAAQIRAAISTFGCDVLLCFFHVKEAIRKHVCLMRSYFFRIIVSIQSQPYDIP